MNFNTIVTLLHFSLTNNSKELFDHLVKNGMIKGNCFEALVGCSYTFTCDTTYDFLFQCSEPEWTAMYFIHPKSRIRQYIRVKQ